MKLSEVKINIATHWLTLNFLGEKIDFETEFRKDYFKNNLLHFRYCIIYAILLYAALGALDYSVFHENLSLLLSIRFLIVIPIFSFGLIYTFNKNYIHLWRLTNNFFVVMANAGFLAMMIFCQPPMNYTFYAGVIICLIFGYTFIRSYFLDASITGLIVLALYVVAATTIGTPSDIFINNFAYLFIINFLGIIICYTTESSARREFMLRKMLQIEKGNVDTANLNLELKVKERTQELLKSTHQLKKEIEERKKGELQNRELERKLIQSQKMESIGTLAGGIAHDFNNILSSIIGFSELALGGAEKGTELEDDLQEVRSAGLRAKDLVKQILTFARQSDEAVKPIQVNVIAKEVLKFLKSSIPSTIQINDKIISDSFIIGSSTQIHQVLMNLCTNAAHAMEGKGGMLDVSLNDITIDKKAIPGLKPGKYIELKITDTGMGISPQNIHTIFEPYFTTKAIGEGTGMGLAVVHGIVEKYGGHITVDSTIGEETCFTIYLPITKKRKIHAHSEKEALPLGNENVLFVDDEAPIAKMGGKVLEQLGYSVTTRTSSVEALELFRSKPQAFDLVVTDMTMPNMTGDKLATELIKIKSNIPVIICTGYSKIITEESSIELGIKGFVYKPIVKTDLAKTIRKILDEANSSE